MGICFSQVSVSVCPLLNLRCYRTIPYRTVSACYIQYRTVRSMSDLLLYSDAPNPAKPSSIAVGGGVAHTHGPRVGGFHRGTWLGTATPFLPPFSHHSPTIPTAPPAPPGKHRPSDLSGSAHRGGNESFLAACIRGGRGKPTTPAAVAPVAPCGRRAVLCAARCRCRCRRAAGGQTWGGEGRNETRNEGTSEGDWWNLEIGCAERRVSE